MVIPPIDLGGVLSKAPELAKLFLYWTFPSVYPWWREDSHHVRWLGDVHRISCNYSQDLEATNVGLVHRRSHNYSQYLEATNGPL